MYHVKNNNAPTRAKVDILSCAVNLKWLFLRLRSSILNSLIYRKTRLAEKGVQLSRNTSANL